MVRGTDSVVCTVSSLACAIRIPKDENGSIHMIQSQPLVGDTTLSVQYCAPELVNEDPFDGYAIDLWSAGVILLALLLGTDALFTVPAADDKVFKEICIAKNLKGYINRLQNTAATTTTENVCNNDNNSIPSLSISESAADLLQNLLLADPNERLTLSKVLKHTWVTSNQQQL